MDAKCLTLELRETESPFIYHPDSNVQIDKDCRGLSKEEVITRYHANELADSDLFIAKALAKIVFGTSDLILKSMEIMHKNEPEKPVTDDPRALKGRLGALVKAGLVKKFKYRQLSDGREHSYFCLNGHGYNFIKRIYRNTDKYDEYLSITPFDEVVKWLAVASIVMNCAKEKTVVRYSMGQPYYVKDEGRFPLYGEVETLVGDQKNLILVEPFYFRRKEDRMSQEEQDDHFKERFRVMNDYITKRYTENPNVIIVCEDMEGIKRSMSLCIKEFPSHIGHFYFTTDPVVYRHGVRKAMLRIDQVEGGIPAMLVNTFNREFI